MYNCHKSEKEIPIIIAPINTYCLRLPQIDLVLSDINPIIGSVKASKIRGRKRIGKQEKTAKTGGKQKQRKVPYKEMGTPTHSRGATSREGM